MLANDRSFHANTRTNGGGGRENAERHGGSEEHKVVGERAAMVLQRQVELDQILDRHDDLVGG